ncbi:hypothetical protein OG21DRAFT_1520677 [Imleria badia]|nr:hypothetical protein OG21DRAFT_1520677 [Imleria badia]
MTLTLEREKELPRRHRYYDGDGDESDGGEWGGAVARSTLWLCPGPMRMVQAQGLGEGQLQKTGVHGSGMRPIGGHGGNQPQPAIMRVEDTIGRDVGIRRHESVEGGLQPQRSGGIRGLKDPDVTGGDVVQRHSRSAGRRLERELHYLMSQRVQRVVQKKDALRHFPSPVQKHCSVALAVSLHFLHNLISPGKLATPEAVPQQEDMDENAVDFTVDWRGSRGSVQFEAITLPEISTDERYMDDETVLPNI